MSPTTKHIYCTYFDSGYLSRALTLISSLREHGDDAEVVVLALDPGVEKFFTENPHRGVTVINVDVLESRWPSLLEVKSSRSRMEYYFTCTPLLVTFAMDKLSSPKSLAIYLDADLYFFDNPSAVIDSLGSGSVGIIEHRYPHRLEKKLSKYGRFNVGWVGFRDTPEGRAVLDWYSDQTLSWCYDIPEAGKYADQGYLDQFPSFEGVRILTDAGFNLAPWNTARHALTTNSEEKILVDGSLLTFFHFHGLRRVSSWYTTSQLVYGAPMSRILRNKIYREYCAILNRNDQEITRKLEVPGSIKKRGNGLHGLVSRTRKWLVDRISIATGNAIRCP